MSQGEIMAKKFFYYSGGPIMPKKMTLRLQTMSDQELKRAYDLNVTRAEMHLMKGESGKYMARVDFYKAVLEEMWDRDEKKLADFGDNPLDRRQTETGV
jgi:hypothetical protein